MNKFDWKKVTEIRLEIHEQDGNEHYNWSFPIYCPRWLFIILSKLER